MSAHLLPKRHPALCRRRRSSRPHAAGGRNVNYAWQYVQAMLTDPSRQTESYFSHIARISAARSLDHADGSRSANTVRFRKKHKLKSLRWLLHCSGNCITDVINILQNIQQSNEDGKLESIIGYAEKIERNFAFSEIFWSAGANIRAVQATGEESVDPKANVYEVLDEGGQCVAKIIHTPAKNSLPVPEMDSAVCGAFGSNDRLVRSEKCPITLEELERINCLEANSRVSSAKRRRSSAKLRQSKSRISLRNCMSGKSHSTTKSVAEGASEVRYKNKRSPQSLKGESSLRSGRDCKDRQSTNCVLDDMKCNIVFDNYNNIIAGQGHVTPESCKRTQNMPLIDVTVNKKMKMENENTLNRTMSEIVSSAQQNAIQSYSNSLSKNSDNITEVLDSIIDMNVISDETKINASNSVRPNDQLQGEFVVRKSSKIHLIRNNTIGSDSQKPVRRNSEPNKLLPTKSVTQVSLEKVRSNALSNVPVTSRITKQSKPLSGTSIRLGKHSKSASESPILKSPSTTTIIKRRVSSSRNYSRKSMCSLSNRKGSNARISTGNRKLSSRESPPTTRTKVLGNGENKVKNVRPSSIAKMMRDETNTEPKKPAKRTKSSHTSLCTRTFSANSINQQIYPLPLKPNATNPFISDTSEERSSSNTSVTSGPPSVLYRPTIISDDNLSHPSTSEDTFLNGITGNTMECLEEQTFADSAILSESTMLRDQAESKRTRTTASLWHAAAQRAPKSSRRQSILGALRQLAESVVRRRGGEELCDESGGGGGEGVSGGECAGAADQEVLSSSPMTPSLPHPGHTRPHTGTTTYSVTNMCPSEKFHPRLRRTLEDWDIDTDMEQELYNSHAMGIQSDPGDIYTVDRGAQDQHPAITSPAAMKAFGRCLRSISLNNKEEEHNKTQPDEKVPGILGGKTEDSKSCETFEDNWEMSVGCLNNNPPFKNVLENFGRRVRKDFRQNTEKISPRRTERNTLISMDCSPSAATHFKDIEGMSKDVMDTECNESVQCGEKYPERESSIDEDHTQSSGCACKTNMHCGVCSQMNGGNHHNAQNECCMYRRWQCMMRRRQLWESDKSGLPVENFWQCNGDANTHRQGSVGCKGCCSSQSCNYNVQSGSLQSLRCPSIKPVVNSSICSDMTATATQMGSSVSLTDSKISCKKTVSTTFDHIIGEGVKKYTSGLVSKEMYGIGRRSVSTSTEINQGEDNSNNATNNSESPLRSSTIHRDSESPRQNGLQRNAASRSKNGEQLAKLSLGSRESHAVRSSAPASPCEAARAAALPPSRHSRKPYSSPCPFGAGSICNHKCVHVDRSPPSTPGWSAPILDSRRNVFVRSPNSTLKCPLSQVAANRFMTKFDVFDQKGEGNAQDADSDIQSQSVKNNSHYEHVNTPFIFHGSKVYTNTPLRRNNGLQDDCKFFGYEWPFPNCKQNNALKKVNTLKKNIAL